MQNATIFRKLFFSVFIVIACFLACALLGFILSLVIFNIDFFSNPAVFSDFSNPENVKVLKFLQAFQSIGLFVIPPIILAYLFSKDIVGFLKLKFRMNPLLVLLAILSMIFAIPVINLTAEVNSMMTFPDFMRSIELWMKSSEQTARLITEAFLSGSTYSGLFINLFVIALIPAIGEELLFRGFFQKIFIEWTKNTHFGILLSAVLFSAFHLQFYGFVPRMLMGVYFGYLFVWTGSIWLPVIVHFVNNSMAVIITFLIGKNILPSSLETIGTFGSKTWHYAIVGLLIFIVIICSIFFISKKLRK